MRTPADRSNNLDVIRFVAAAAVIYGHAFPLNLASSPGFFSNSVQTIGVKIFFMLSGFLISQSWDSDPNVFRFIQRRALRLFPALAVVLVLSVCVLGALVTTLPLNEYFGNARFWSYLGNINLNISYDLPGVFGSNPYKTAVNGSLWSLPVEVSMYLLTPLILTAGAWLRRPRLVLWVATLVSIALSTLYVRMGATPPIAVFYGIGLVSLLDVAPFFIVGMLCCAYGWHRALSPQTAALAFLIAMLFPSATPVVDELVLLVLIPIVVLGLGFSKEPRYATAGRHGDVSYGLYLYGFVVQQTVTHFWGGAMPPVLNALISFVVSLALAYASWHLVEKRALELRPSTRGASAAGITIPDEAPAPGSRRVHVEAVIALVVVNTLLVLPWLLFRTQRWKHLGPGLLQLSFETFALGLAAALAPPKFRRAANVTAAVLVVALLVFNLYDVGYRFGFQRAAAVLDDLPLAISGYHYVQDLAGAWTYLLVVSVPITLGLLTIAVRHAWNSVAIAAHGNRVWLALLSAFSLGTLVASFVAPSPFGGVRLAPVVNNLKTSFERRASLRSALLEQPDERYRSFASARLSRRPNVYLVMLEAYGQRLVSDPSMKEPFCEIARRADAKLSAAGYRSRSGRSAAPVFGGRSWLSIATVLTGVHIDQPAEFALLMPIASKVPSFFDYFRQQGYVTYAAHPGNRDRLATARQDAYAADVYIDGPEFRYSGTPYGWVRIPDQFALGHYRAKLATEERPFFAFYMSVSTHHPWLKVPYAASWEALQQTNAVDVPDSPIEGSDQIPAGTARDYFDAVAYQWRVLADFITSEAEEDAVFILVGDHQPLLERRGDDAETVDADATSAAATQSSNALLHVITRDDALLARFPELTEGLFVDAGPAQWKHEGIYSTVLSRLFAQYGDPSTSGVREYPDGLKLNALRLP
ncbi:MAG: acyltransferase family protein [Archangium sp.]